MDHLEHLRGLTPHARLHAVRLLAVHRDLIVTSGFRSPERNRAVGGKPRSYHLTGRAIDVVSSRARLEDAARTASAQRVSARCTGPEEVVMEDDHLHLAW